MRYQARSHRPDTNQSLIVKGLRELGALVIPIGHPVDLLVGYRGQTYLFELKDGSRKPSERKLRDSQVEFFNNWNGGVALKIESLGEAFAALGVDLS